MSHFYLMVLVPPVPPSGQIEAHVDMLLAPYNEQTEVPEYDTDCWCVGQEASLAAMKAAEEAHPLDRVRELHHWWVKNQGLDNFSDEADRHWKMASKAHVLCQKKAEREHPMFGKPDPKCKECKGTGKHKSTYNPKSKWDWYVVGGRWDGVIQGEARKSNDNGFNFGDEHHQVGHNIRPVKTFPEPMPDKDIPFAIVTPDGEWHEKGKMGWFANVSDEDDDWKSRARTILANHKSCVAVGVDCHI